jgi:hypothetical protein
VKVITDIEWFLQQEEIEINRIKLNDSYENDVYEVGDENNFVSLLTQNIENEKKKLIKNSKKIPIFIEINEKEYKEIAILINNKTKGEDLIKLSIEGIFKINFFLQKNMKTKTKKN